VAGIRTRARWRAIGCAQALGEVARAALALPHLPDDEDWQLNAIAYADEALLRDLYDGYLILGGGALREAGEG